jgi:hypothetical protein
MTPWLALSLGLWLGQMPETTPSLPPDADTQDPAALQFRAAWERALQNADATDEGQEATDGAVQMPAFEVRGSDTAAMGTGGAGTAGTTDEAQSSSTAASGTGSTAGATGNLQQQVNALRSEVQALQAQVAAQQQQDADMRERADTLEQQRQVRLNEIERARQWLITADKALEAGELDIGDTLLEADAALRHVVQSATDAGSGQTVLLVEDARTRIAQAFASTWNRNTYKARWDLFFAYERLRDARRQNLDEASATTVTR